MVKTSQPTQISGLLLLACVWLSLAPGNRLHGADAASVASKFPEPEQVLADFYRRRHPGPDDVFLLIEVSDSTLDQDRETKLPAYGRAGIPEVWIVNLNELTVEVYREPHFEGYVDRTVLRAGELASPAAFPDVNVDVVELLRR